MANQMELTADLRTVTGKKVKQLRAQGMVPATMFGRAQNSVSLQLNRPSLQKVLFHGGKDVILMLKIGEQPPVPVMIKDAHRDPISGSVNHVDFYMVNATEKLKTPIRLHFVNDTTADSQGDVAVQRLLNEVMVECLPSDLPASIQVDLSQLKEVDSVIRVRDLQPGTGVTILTDPSELVAAVHLAARAEKEEETTEAAEEAPAPAAQ